VIRGGTKLEKYLTRTAERLGDGATVRVGFLERATYPPQARNASKLLKGLDTLNATGPFQKGSKPSRLRDYRKSLKLKATTFVGAPQPAIVLTVATVAYWNNYGTATAPARPFFTNMIEQDSPNWSAELAAAVLKAGYDSTKALTLMGVHINDKLVQSINDWPADNAPLTVAIKGFNKGLTDRGIMLRSTDYEVVAA
jgi:hypothetical protein